MFDKRLLAGSGGKNPRLPAVMIRKGSPATGGQVGLYLEDTQIDEGHFDGFALSGDGSLYRIIFEEGKTPDIRVSTKFERDEVIQLIEARQIREQELDGFLINLERRSLISTWFRSNLMPKELLCSTVAGVEQTWVAAVICEENGPSSEGGKMLGTLSGRVVILRPTGNIMTVDALTRINLSCLAVEIRSEPVASQFDHTFAIATGGQRYISDGQKWKTVRNADISPRQHVSLNSYAEVLSGLGLKWAVVPIIRRRFRLLPGSHIRCGSFCMPLNWVTELLV